MSGKLIVGFIVLAVSLVFSGCPSNPSAPYNVTYNGNSNTGGNVPIDGNTYDEGAMVTVLGNSGNLVKTGSTFAGWNTLANGSGTNYLEGETFTMGVADVTLFARWTAATVSGVTLNKSSTTIVIGSTEQLTATVEPADAADSSVSWTSDNENVATVNSSGLVTAIAQGAATITVTTTDGGHTDTCDSTVKIWTMAQSGSSSIVGSNITYTNNQDSFSFMVLTCPGATFPTGTDDLGGEATVGALWVGETEATNQLIASVYQWAYDEGKMAGGTVDTTTVTLFGQELLDLDNATSQIIFSGGLFSVDLGFEEYPVPEISWYGAILLFNWLTEMVDGNEDEVVYSGMDADWLDDETIENTSNTGFRLLSSEEWECAARWRDDSTNTVAGYSDPWFTKGNSASGAYTYHDDETDTNPANGIVDGKDANDQVAVYGYYYDGGWVATGVGSSAAVKSKTANALSLYDMSGNIFEWCFTESGSYRILRGGIWSDYATPLQTGFVNSFNLPTSASPAIGFRFCRTP